MIPEMTEIYGFKGYYITQDGRVFSDKKNRGLHELVLKEDKDGYLEIGMYKKDKRYFRRVHRLVAETYIPNINKLPQINHMDGNTTNNNVSNLEWSTCRDNLLHSFRELGRQPSITTNKPIMLLHKKSHDPLFFNSIKDLSYYLNMSHEHLGRILNNKSKIKSCKKLKPYLVTFIE